MSVTQADLVLMDATDLKKIAESYGIKTVGQSREQLLEAIQSAAIHKEEALRRKVVESQRAEALLNLGIESRTGQRPAPETVAILASKKVRVMFLNLEDRTGTDEPGADITFYKGKFRFHLYDQRDHILPECLIAESVEECQPVMDKVTAFFVATGMKKSKAERQAKGVMQRLSLPMSCRRPVYADKKLPTGETVPVIARWVPRFEFKLSRKEVPKDAEFGPIESEVLHV